VRAIPEKLSTIMMIDVHLPAHGREILLSSHAKPASAPHLRPRIRISVGPTFSGYALKIHNLILPAPADRETWVSE